MRRNKLLFFSASSFTFFFFLFFLVDVRSVEFIYRFSYHILFILLAKYDKDWANVKSAVLIFLKNNFVIGR